MYHVTLAGTLGVDPGKTDGLDALTDRVMDALLDAGAIDPTLSGSFATGDMSITVSIDVDTPTAALSEAEQLVHSALAAAGAGIDDWDHIDVDRVAVPA